MSRLSKLSCDSCAGQDLQREGWQVRQPCKGTRTAMPWSLAWNPRVCSWGNDSCFRMQRIRKTAPARAGRREMAAAKCCESCATSNQSSKKQDQADIFDMFDVFLYQVARPFPPSGRYRPQVESVL